MDTLNVVGIIAAVFILFHIGVFLWFFVKAANYGKIKYEGLGTCREEDPLTKWDREKHSSSLWDFDPVNAYYHTHDE